MQLSVCSKPTGKNCVTLTNSHYVGGCANGAAVLDPAFVGDYLRVDDQRDGAGPHFMLRYAVGSPYGLDLSIPGPRLSTAIIGRIAPATGLRTADCGPPPLNSASVSKKGVTTIECGLGCRAVLIAKDKRIEARLVRRLPRRRARAARPGERPLPLRDPILLRLPSWFSADINHDRVRMSVKIDGEQVARRTRLPG